MSTSTGSEGSGEFYLKKSLTVDHYREVLDTHVHDVQSRENMKHANPYSSFAIIFNTNAITWSLIVKAQENAKFTVQFVFSRFFVKFSYSFQYLSRLNLYCFIRSCDKYFLMTWKIDKIANGFILLKVY